MFLFEYIADFIEYILRDPLIEISGFLGMFVLLIAFFNKDDYTVKKLMLLAALFWGAHFYLLGVYTGLASIVIWVLRIILSIKFERNIKAFWFVIGLTAIIGIFTVDSLSSSLPILASLMGAYSYFFLEAIKLRLMMVVNSIMYLVYNISVGSVSGIINEALVQVILIVTIYRMLHPGGGSQYYMQKVKDVLWKTRRPDYDRFIFIHDRLKLFRKKAGNHFLNVIHYDLRNLVSSKKYEFLHKIKH